MQSTLMFKHNHIIPSKQYTQKMQSIAIPMFKQTISTHPNNIHINCNPYPCSNKSYPFIQTIYTENAIHSYTHVQTNHIHSSKQYTHKLQSISMFKQIIFFYPNNIHINCNPYPCSNKSYPLIQTIYT